MEVATELGQLSLDMSLGGGRAEEEEDEEDETYRESLANMEQQYYHSSHLPTETAPVQEVVPLYSEFSLSAHDLFPEEVPVARSPLTPARTRALELLRILAHSACMFFEHRLRPQPSRLYTFRRLPIDALATSVLQDVAVRSAQILHDADFLGVFSHAGELSHGIHSLSRERERIFLQEEGEEYSITGEPNLRVPMAAVQRTDQRSVTLLCRVLREIQPTMSTLSLSEAGLWGPQAGLAELAGTGAEPLTSRSGEEAQAQEKPTRARFAARLKEHVRWRVEEEPDDAAVIRTVYTRLTMCLHELDLHTHGDLESISAMKATPTTTASLSRVPTDRAQEEAARQKQLTRLAQHSDFDTRCARLHACELASEHMCVLWLWNAWSRHVLPELQERRTELLCAFYSLFLLSQFMAFPEHRWRTRGVIERKLFACSDATAASPTVTHKASASSDPVPCTLVGPVATHLHMLESFLQYYTDTHMDSVVHAWLEPPFREQAIPCLLANALYDSTALALLFPLRISDALPASISLPELLREQVQEHSFSGLVCLALVHTDADQALVELVHRVLAHVPVEPEWLSSQPETKEATGVSATVISAAPVTGNLIDHLLRLRMEWAREWEGKRERVTSGALDRTILTLLAYARVVDALQRYNTTHDMETLARLSEDSARHLLYAPIRTGESRSVPVAAYYAKVRVSLLRVLQHERDFGVQRAWVLRMLHGWMLEWEGITRADLSVITHESEIHAIISVPVTVTSPAVCMKLLRESLAYKCASRTPDFLVPFLQRAADRHVPRLVGSLLTATHAHLGFLVGSGDWFADLSCHDVLSPSTHVISSEYTRGLQLPWQNTPQVLGAYLRGASKPDISDTWEARMHAAYAADTTRKRAVWKYARAVAARSRLMRLLQGKVLSELTRCFYHVYVRVWEKAVLKRSAWRTCEDWIVEQSATTDTVVVTIEGNLTEEERVVLREMIDLVRGWRRAPREEEKRRRSEEEIGEDSEEAGSAGGGGDYESSGGGAATSSVFWEICENVLIASDIDALFHVLQRVFACVEAQGGGDYAGLWRGVDAPLRIQTSPDITYAPSMLHADLIHHIAQLTFISGFSPSDDELGACTYGSISHAPNASPGMCFSSRAGTQQWELLDVEGVTAHTVNRLPHASSADVWTHVPESLVRTKDTFFIWTNGVFDMRSGYLARDNIPVEVREDEVWSDDEEKTAPAGVSAQRFTSYKLHKSSRTKGERASDLPSRAHLVACVFPEGYAGNVWNVVHVQEASRIPVRMETPHVAVLTHPTSGSSYTWTTSIPIDTAGVYTVTVHGTSRDEWTGWKRFMRERDVISAEEDSDVLGEVCRMLHGIAAARDTRVTAKRLCDVIRRYFCAGAWLPEYGHMLFSAGMSSSACRSDLRSDAGMQLVTLVYVVVSLDESVQ